MAGMSDDLMRKLLEMHASARGDSLPPGQTSHINARPDIYDTPEQHEAKLRAMGVAPPISERAGPRVPKELQGGNSENTFDPSQQTAGELSQAAANLKDAAFEFRQQSQASPGGKTKLQGEPEELPAVYGWEPGMRMDSAKRESPWDRKSHPALYDWRPGDSLSGDPFQVGGLPAEDRAKSALPSERNPPADPFVGPPEPPEEKKTWQQNLHASLASILGGGQHSESDEVADALNRVGGLGGGGGGPGGGGNAAALGKAVGFGQDVMGAMAGDPMSMARAAQKVTEEVDAKVDAAKETAMAMPRAFVDAAGKQQFGEVGSSFMKGGADTMHGMSEFTKGPFGLDTPMSKMFEAGEKIFQLGKAAFDAFQAVRDWSAGLHEANMKFAEFSGAMATVQAQQEVRQIQLDRERGNRRAEDARALAESKNRLDRQLAPIEDWWAGLMNKLSVIVNDTLGGMLEALGFKDEQQEFRTEGLGREMFEAGARRNWIDEFGLPEKDRIGRPNNVR